MAGGAAASPSIAPPPRLFSWALAAGPAAPVSGIVAPELKVEGCTRKTASQCGVGMRAAHPSQESSRGWSHSRQDGRVASTGPELG